MAHTPGTSRSLSVAQAAKVLGAPSSEVIAALEAGDLIGTRKRDRHGWRIQAQDLHDYMTSQAIAPPPSPQLPRFLKLEDIAEILSVTLSQAYALVRSGELPAIKIGGRGQWRVESKLLEVWIQDRYAATRALVHDRPLGDPDAPATGDVDQDRS